jgi:glycosyltransferase involved in cell wall biosynthesis
MYAYHPPLTVGVTASLIRWMRGIPLVYDIQDMWPDTLRATGMLNNARVLALVGRVCEWVYKRADQLVVLSPGFKRLLMQRGVPESKIEVIYNWADESSLWKPNSQVPIDFPGAEQFRILFAGNMGKAQALGTVLHAAELLKARGSRVCWVMLGSGVEMEHLKEQTQQQQLDNVIFLPAVPMGQVGAYMQAADALLVHLRKDPLFEVTIPSKTQAYMAAGKPILMAVEGDSAALVRKADAGVIARSEDAVALADAAEQLANQSPAELSVIGEQANAFYRRELSLNVGVSHFVNLFKKLLTPAN